MAFEVIDSIKKSLKEKLIGVKVEKKTIENFVKKSLMSRRVENHHDSKNDLAQKK